MPRDALNNAVQITTVQITTIPITTVPNPETHQEKTDV